MTFAFKAMDGSDQDAFMEALQDDTPVFDLRLSNVHRGKGLGVSILASLCDHVFTMLPAILRSDWESGTTTAFDWDDFTL